jgi:hypothetical protein
MADLPVLVRSLSDEASGTKKQRMERAEVLAGLVSTESAREIVLELAQFTLAAMASMADSEVFYACTVVIALLKQLPGDAAVALFGRLSEFAREEVVPNRLNALLHSMKKLLKRFEVDAEPFVGDLLAGKIAVIGGLPLYSCHDEKTMIFYFLATYIRKNPLKSAHIVTMLIDCIPFVVFAMLPSVLEPIEAGVSLEIVNHEGMEKLSSAIGEVVEKLGIEMEEAVCACFEILCMIVKTAPDVLDYTVIFEAVLALVGAQADDDEETDGPCDTAGYPKIVRFVLESYTSPFLQLEVNDALLKQLLQSLPLRPESEAMDEILPLVLRVLDDPVKFKAAVVPALIGIAELLMLKKADLDEYNLPAELLAQAKAKLQQTVRKDRGIERQITKTFQSSRPKLNRFSALLK